MTFEEFEKNEECINEINYLKERKSMTKTLKKFAIIG